jgi:type II secretory pathway component PulC
MKPLFNDHTLSILNTIALPIVIALSVSTALVPFLKSTSIEHPRSEIIPFFEPYHLGQLFALHFDGNAAVMKKVIQDVLTPVPHRLNAVYMDGSHSFVGVNDHTATTFVDKGAMYKNLYRLVSVTPEQAVFTAYGQRMVLRLGEEGHLNLKESVTSYVPDETATASNFAIPRSTIDRYTENMGETWKNITINEVVQQGKIVGFRVDEIALGTPFALLGLQKGDIITGVDNKPLDSYAAVFAAYQTGLHHSAIKITVLRNNQTKDLEYEISR